MRPTLQLRLWLLSWLVGLALGLWISPTLAIILAGFGSLLYWYKRWWWSFSLVLLGFGATYYTWYEQQFYPTDLRPFVGETVELQATVKGEARLRGKRQTVRLQVQAWRQDQASWQPLGGQILWHHAPLPAFRPGDNIVLQGTIAHLVNFSADFDARAYWSRWGVEHELVRGTIIERSYPAQALNLQTRTWGVERLSEHLADPHRTIALGMLVGLKEKLPKSLDEAFKASGLTHLLVVSGTNVTLLVLALSLWFKPLGPWWCYSLSAVAIMAYLYLVGFDPPALRASLLGIIAGLALTAGYFCEYRNLLLLVASLLGLADPHFITHDVSFWLSFTATFGLLLGVPLLYQWLRGIKWPRLRLLLCASVAAQVAVFPLLIVQFGSFPYAGLITNLVAEPLVPLIMLLGAGGILIGDLNLLGLETLWGLGLWAALAGLIALAYWGAALPVVLVPVWIGWLWGVLLIVLGLWALFSSYYQKRYWEVLEAEAGR